MVEIKSKSLIIGIILGFAAWLWAFIIVGSAIYDFIENKPRPFDFGFYVAMLIVTAIVSIAIFALYLWKYEQNNPIISNGWGRILHRMDYRSLPPRRQTILPFTTS